MGITNKKFKISIDLFLHYLQLPLSPYVEI